MRTRGTQLVSSYDIPTLRTLKTRIWLSSLPVPKDSHVLFQSQISPKTSLSTPEEIQKMRPTKVATLLAHLP